MGRLTGFLHWIAAGIGGLAAQWGGAGLVVVALLDSSFLSLPEISDALVVVWVMREPSRWIYYGFCATAGSVGGCYLLYAVARRGGETFLRKRFQPRRVERGLELFRKHGLLAIVIPAILPPPMPFKIFVLLAGVARVSPFTFIAAIVVGRGFRYWGEAWLAYEYGDRATAYIHANLPQISVAVAAAAAVGGAIFILWRRRTA